MELLWLLTVICVVSSVFSESEIRNKRLLESDSIWQRLQELELTVQTLQTKKTEDELSISKLQSSLSHLQSVVNSQATQIGNLQNKVNTKKQGCQTGSHALSDSHGNAHSRTVTIQFNPPFAEPPKVVWGTSAVDIGRDHNARYGSSISHVSSTGFVLESHTWSDTDLFHLSVQWMACPAHI